MQNDSANVERTLRGEDVALREWRIETPIRNEVRLEHGWVSGRAKLFVGDQLVFERPMTIFDPGFRYLFTIDDTIHIVKAEACGIGYNYSLDGIDAVEQGLMGLFFNRHGWRRQLACVTLILALGFTADWIDSMLRSAVGSRFVHPAIPTWTFVLPLTILSLYLWFSKPSDTKQR